MNRTMRAQEILAEVKHELEVLRASTVGWTEVNYPHAYTSRYHAIDVELWCDENLGDFKKSGRTFYFKDEKDASMFLLKFT